MCDYLMSYFATLLCGFNFAMFTGNKTLSTTSSIHFYLRNEAKLKLLVIIINKK